MGQPELLQHIESANDDKQQEKFLGNTPIFTVRRAIWRPRTRHQSQVEDIDQSGQNFAATRALLSSNTVPCQRPC